MNPKLLSLYHRLPPLAQTAAATAQGVRLQRARHGPIFEAELEQIRRRDRYTRAEWIAERDARLQLILHRSRLAPHYAGLAIERVRSADDLPRLPILDKEAVRARPLDFLASDRDPRGLLAQSTSGTTGTPLTTYWSPELMQRWSAQIEARIRGWAGVSRRDPLAMLGGRLVVPPERRRPPFWVYNAAGRQLYMSAYHLAPDTMDAYLDEMKRRRVVYAFGYASALDTLAEHALAVGRDDVQLRVAISNAEPFYAHQRERIARAFRCETRDTYAPTEIAAAAFECHARRLHVAWDVGIMEVVDESGDPVPPGTAGELVFTGLINRDHILIRYPQGDRGVLAPLEERCPCGSAMPILRAIEGRADDVLVTKDGRRVGRLDPVFKMAQRVKEAQIIQEAIDRLVVKVVPAAGYDHRDEASIRHELMLRMGEIHVDIERVEHIERTSMGKFRAVISRLPG